MPSLSPLVLLSAALVGVAVVFQTQFSPACVRLSYFDVAGRAEVSRAAFRLGGVAFEDERLSRVEFLQLKPSLPYGQVPVVSVGGELVAESQAILRYAARVGGLYPSDDGLAMLLTEEIFSTVDEASETKVGPARREKDDEKKKQLQDELVADGLPTTLRQLEGRLKHISELPYFQTPDKVFAHEVAVWRFVDVFKTGGIDFIPTTIVDAYPTINVIHSKISTVLAKTTATKTASASAVATKPLQRPKTIRLTYFDIKGRAEFIRLAFTIGGVEFHDERLSFEAFRELKPTLPYGQVPVLTVNGEVVAQSFGLLRYAGALGGLYPHDDPLAAAKIDEIIARSEDIGYVFQPSSKEKDQDKKRALREAAIAERIPKALAALDKRVAQWMKSSKFVFGDELSVADLAVFQIVQSFRSGNLDFVPATIIDEYKSLLEINDAVLQHPRVVEWYAKTK